MKDDTLLQHGPRPTLHPENFPLVGPLYQNVKFSVKKVSDLFRKDFFFYSRASNPTVTELELLLAKLQGTEAGICLASGVAALTVPMLSLLKSGEHVIVFVQSYKPVREFTRGLLAKYGVRFTIVSLNDLSQLEAIIQKNKTKLICFEACTNPLTRVADFDQIFSVARRNQVLTLIDNTFGGFHNLGQLKADLYVHSLTKYAGGHGDVLGGAVLGSHALLKQIREDAILLGPAMDPHAAFLTTRGMKTYSLRFQRHSASAFELAAWLEKHPRVERVFYPGLPSHPDYAIAKKHFKDFGCVLALEIKGGWKETEKFLESLQLFKLAPSLASTESLAAPAKLFYGGDLKDSELVESGLKDTTVRLSVGLEAVEDLKADLARALEG